MDYAVSTVGFAVGFLVGLTGIGGGALMTPILILLLGAVPKVAIATDLLFAAITKMAGLALHNAYQSIDWKIVRRLALGSVPAAALTSAILHMIGEGGEVDSGLRFALGIMLAITAIAMALQPKLHELGKSFRLDATECFKRFQAPLTILLGCIMGVVVTLTSVGAGALGAVLLLYLYPLRLTPTKIVGTDLAHAIPLALIGGIGHLAMGNVDFRLLGSLVMGSIPGALLGAWGAHKVPGRFLRLLLAAILAALSLRILNT